MLEFDKSFSYKNVKELNNYCKKREKQNDLEKIKIRNTHAPFMIINSPVLGLIALEEIISTDSSQATIYKGIVVSTRKVYVIKEYHPDKDNKHIGYAKKEYLFTSSLNHKYLLKSHDIVKNGERIYIIMDYIPNNDLYYYMEKCQLINSGINMMQFGGLPLNIVKWVFRQIIIGVNYLHANGICHRDLKIENILMDGKFNIKIADFGFATSWSPFTKNTESIGSMHYAAPELFNDNVNYFGPEVDIWSCGVLLYVLLFAKLPFRRENELPYQAIRRIKNTSYYIPDFLIDSHIHKLLKSMLEVDPLKRATACHILENPWLNNFDKPLNVITIRNTLKIIKQPKHMSNLELPVPKIEMDFTEATCGKKSANARMKTNENKIVSPRNIKIYDSNRKEIQSKLSKYNQRKK